MLHGMHELHTLDLKRNPLTKVAKYRDKVVVASCDRLGQLDGKEVTARQRDFLRHLEERRAQQQQAKAGGPGRPTAATKLAGGSRGGSAGGEDVDGGQFVQANAMSLQMS
jgi:hypothetical protein